MLNWADWKAKCFMDEVQLNGHHGLTKWKDWGWSLCTVDGYVERLKKTYSKLKVKSEYLLGLNEGWYRFPVENQVEHMRKLMMPTAKRLGLKFISPTLMNNDKKAIWNPKMFALCYAYRNDHEYPCNVEDIKVLSIHFYICDAGWWPREFKKLFDYNLEKLEQLIPEYSAKLGTKEKAEFDKDYWKQYLESRELWVTEYNCGVDVWHVPRDSPYWGGKTKIPNDENCRRATG